MKYIAEILLAWWLVLATWSYINCYEVAVWRAEMTPIIGIVIAVVLISRKFRFSPLAYVLMAVLIYLHTIWAHYTFERVPFDRFTNLFNFERNHFDRIAHISVWFYAYAIIEYVERNKLTNSKWMSYLFALFAIVTVAGFYEIIEWVYAINGDPDAGIAFLGSQGDIWDAQKDMLADTVWWIMALLVYFFVSKK